MNCWWEFGGGVVLFCFVFLFFFLFFSFSLSFFVFVEGEGGNVGERDGGRQEGKEREE